jgi:hypothetical protein
MITPRSIGAARRTAVIVAAAIPARVGAAAAALGVFVPLARCRMRRFPRRCRGRCRVSRKEPFKTAP